MNNITVFENNEFGEVRVIETNNEFWFVAKDICDCLEIKNSRDALKRLDDDEKSSVVLTDGTSGNPNKSIVNEYGLYNLILSSRKPEAKQFKRWVTHDVLPSIRKNGLYAKDELLDNPDLLLEIVTRLKEERDAKKELEAKVEILEPKAEYADKVLTTENTHTTTQIAKSFGMTAIKLNKILKEAGIQYKQSGQWLLNRKYDNQDFVKTETYLIERSSGERETRLSTKWTEKGRRFIYELLVEKGHIVEGDYPLEEEDIIIEEEERLL